MDSNDFTSRDLILVLDEAGTAFGWSRAYMAVMATSIGAAFTALGLDESKDSISVAPADVVDQMAKIMASSASLGRAPATGRSYATTWRRLATIAHRWRLEGGAEPDGHHAEAGLRGRVIHLAGTDMGLGHRGDADDTPTMALPDHFTGRQLGAVKRSRKVHVDGLLPNLGCKFHNVHEGADSGVVDEHIDLSVAAYGLFHHTLHGTSVRDIALQSAGRGGSLTP